MEQLNYTYSRLSSATVLNLLTEHYELPDLKQCQFYTLGLHDNYLVEGNHSQYILRIYRRDWRSTEEIQFELNLLAHLKTKGANVSSPLTTKTAELSFQINCAEGSRSATLFDYAKGISPGHNISIEQSHLLGTAVAQMHLASDSFRTNIQKQPLDTDYLLDQSLHTIKPFVKVEMQSYLDRLGIKIKNQLPPLPHKAGVSGICAGDINPGNFHINKHNKITLFDFDQCGFGYRAFEVGKYFSSLHSLTNKQKLSEAFIAGYQHSRPLSDQEQLSIPCFEIVSNIWVMAIHVYNHDRIGYKHLQESYWMRQLDILRELDDMYLK